jgi:small subunit ribosomal protein S16
MLKIRLKRLGRKKKVFYKIVLMETLSRRDGKSIEEIGYYDPLTKILNINTLLLDKYLKMGAYPTDTVRHLIMKYLTRYSVE